MGQKVELTWLVTAFDETHLVLAVHVANFSSAYTNVTSRNIGTGVEVTAEFCHESLAETTNLSITLSSRVEVGSTLAASHGKACECVLENLLKSKKLQHTLVDCGVETESTLVGTENADKIATK